MNHLSILNILTNTKININSLLDTGDKPAVKCEKNGNLKWKSEVTRSSWKNPKLVFNQGLFIIELSGELIYIKQTINKGVFAHIAKESTGSGIPDVSY